MFWSIPQEAGKDGEIRLRQKGGLGIFWGLFLFIFQITWKSEKKN